MVGLTFIIRWNKENGTVENLIGQFVNISFRLSVELGSTLYYYAAKLVNGLSRDNVRLLPKQHKKRVCVAVAVCVYVCKLTMVRCLIHINKHVHMVNIVHFLWAFSAKDLMGSCVNHSCLFTLYSNIFADT